MTKFIHRVGRVALRHHAGGLSDGQLLGLYVERQDEAAFEAIVRRHAAMVMGVCRRILADRHDAEDAFQATFLVLVRKAGSIGVPRLLANWLYGVAYNVALKARAAAARRRAREKQVAEMPEPEVAVPTENWPDLLPVLDQELSRLPDKYRVAIVLCELEGKGHREAARDLGWPIGTVSGRLARGKALLAKRLARHGLSLSAGSLTALLCQQAASASVRASLLSATLKAASLFAAGPAIPPLLSPQVAALTQGALKSMLLTQLKVVTPVLFLVAMIGITVTTYCTGAQSPAGAARLQASKQAPRPAADKERSANLLRNGGIEEGDQSPAHWSQGAEIPGVEYIWDKQVGYKSKASLCLHKTANRYFPVAQWYQVFDRQGDSPKLRLSAQVKAEKVTKAILDVIFLDEKGDWISHKWAAYIGAQQPNDPPADHDWKEYSGQVKIPESAKKIQIGLQIYGPGKVWFDDVRAEYVR